MYIPHTLFPCTGLRIRIERVHVRHEFILVEKMYKLSAMEFHSIDQENGVVDTGNNRRSGIWKAASTIPGQIIR